MIARAATLLALVAALTGVSVALVLGAVFRPAAFAWGAGGVLFVALVALAAFLLWPTVSGDDEAGEAAWREHLTARRPRPRRWDRWV